MTHEQLIAKAHEEAEQWGIPAGYLQNAKLREIVKVRFISSESAGEVEIDLDRVTGELVSAMCSGIESRPRTSAGAKTERTSTDAMTQEQLIAKAREEAEQWGIPAGHLRNAKLREIVRIFFVGPGPAGAVQIDLDRGTGQFVSASAPAGIELLPRNKGRDFSKAAQDLLGCAYDESKRMGCHHVGTDHLLLAAVSRGTEIGATLLANAGLTAEAVRARMLAAGSPPEDAPTGYGPSMRGVLRSACRYVDSLGHTETTPEHLILGLLDETDGGARNLFSHFGVNTEETKNKILEQLRKGS